jgi:hypothetical protein
VDRNQILQLLNTLDTPTLLRALSMNGVQVQMDQNENDIIGQLGLEDPQEKWNDIRIGLDKPVKPPIHSPEAVFRMMPPQRQQLMQQFPLGRPQPMEEEMMEE